ENCNSRAATARPHRRGVGPTVGTPARDDPSCCATPVLLPEPSGLVPHRLSLVETFPLWHHGVFGVARRGLTCLEDAEPGAVGTNHQRGTGERGHQPTPSRQQ